MVWDALGIRGYLKSEKSNQGFMAEKSTRG